MGTGRWVRSLAQVVLTVGLTFVLIEGAASAALTLRHVAGLFHSSPIHSVRYDAQLGWRGLPNVDIPDMFGKGVFLTTDGGGFRRTGRAPQTRAGLIRVVCSGASYTFGYGVDDDHTWCADLTHIDPRIESVNVGQPGYGVDQSFLLFRQIDVDLHSSIHVFAFTDAELERLIWNNEAFDYGKPSLAIRDGVLRVDNVPVRRHPFYMPKERVLAMVESLKVYELAARLRQDWRTATGVVERDEPAEIAARKEAEQIALRVFTELRNLADAGHSDLLLVHLPMERNCHVPSGASWWTALGPKVQDLGLDAVDLTDMCRGLTPHEVDDLFISEDASVHASAGHYTEKGNQFMAAALYQRLRPLIARRFVTSRPS